MLDEDSDAPNLVPGEKPRGILAGRIEAELGLFTGSRAGP